VKALLLVLLLIVPSFASKRCQTCTRDSRGRILRSYRAKHQFRSSHPCPATGKTTGRCPDFVIDHVIPLECGGRDAASNMAWQSRAEAKAKDKTEKDCRQ
jgi:5-methylcytosine-specific restriction endonuclease McrA